MPFLAAAAIIRFTSSSVISGGDAERSVVGCERFFKELLHARRARRRNDDERPGRHRPLVLQRMHRAAWDVDEIPWLRVDRLPARLERGGALQI